MRKAVGFFVVFAVALGIGYFLLRNYTSLGRAGDSQAKRNLLAILDKQPAAANLPDNAIVKAAAKIEPAVVNIDTIGERSQPVTNPFGEQFERRYGFQGKGSGVIISPDGYLVTNNHVIEGANRIRITTMDDKKYDGRLIGADPDADLAIVKIDATNLPHADLGNSDDLKVGEYVIAIGNPLGIGTTVTHGIISATNRRNLRVSEDRFLKEALQTDAPINKGNSGGALANMNGQLIGINTAIYSESGGSIGIGFAIPINSARNILRDMVARGRTLPITPGQPYIGVVAYPLYRDYADRYGLQQGQGVVLDVFPLTPADNAGLKPGNVLLEIDGKPVNEMGMLRTIIGAHKVGDVITLKVVRGDGSREDVKVTVGRRPTGIR
jgi:serine protease DegQ